MSERQIRIFQLIIDEFTRTAEPVGSNRLKELLDFECSSATIRNEMAALEELELLEKTHTSSGRVPSSKGYRYYIEHLMVKEIDDSSKFALQSVFDNRTISIEETVKQTCEILSHMTNLTSVVLGPESHAQTLQKIELVPISDQSAVALIVTSHGHTENKTFKFNESVSIEDIKTCTEILNDKLVGTSIDEIPQKLIEIEPELAANVVRYQVLLQAFLQTFSEYLGENMYTSGKNNLLYVPEFAKIEKLQEVMKMLDDGSVFTKIGNPNRKITIEIGGENEIIDVDDVAVVSSTFQIDDDSSGRLMVVGPTRMPYNKVVALTEYMSDLIEELYRGEDKKD